MISFDPDELGQSTQSNKQSSEDETDSDKDVLHFFHELCTKVDFPVVKLQSRLELIFRRLMLPAKLTTRASVISLNQ